MSIESDLRKDGITVVAPLDTLSVNTIARDVAEKLCKAFPNQFRCTRIYTLFARDKRQKRTLT